MATSSIRDVNGLMVTHHDTPPYLMPRFRMENRRGKMAGVRKHHSTRFKRVVVITC